MANVTDLLRQKVPLKYDWIGPKRKNDCYYFRVLSHTTRGICISVFILKLFRCSSHAVTIKELKMRCMIPFFMNHFCTIANAQWACKRIMFFPACRQRVVKMQRNTCCPLMSCRLQDSRAVINLSRQRGHNSPSERKKNIDFAWKPQAILSLKSLQRRCRKALSSCVSAESCALQGPQAAPCKIAAAAAVYSSA